MHNWGKWRLHQLGNRPHYIRTWHGWEDGEKVARRAQARARFKDNVRQKLVWKTTTTDYRWIFWDIDGTKQHEYEYNRRHSLIRHLPGWMRSYEPGSLLPDFRITPNRLDAAKEGKVSMRSFRHSSEIQPLGFSFTRNQAWLRSEIQEKADTPIHNHCTVGSGPTMSGALHAAENEHSLGTVRRRKLSGGRVQVWHANSKETFRATRTQFLDSKAPPEAIADTSSIDDEDISAIRLQSIPAAHGGSLGSARRVSSIPLFKALHSLFDLKPWSSLPNTAETKPSRSRLIPTFPTARAPDLLSMPERFEDLHVSCNNIARSYTLGIELEVSKPPLDWDTTENPGCGIESKSKFMVLNPFQSIGNEYSGTAGRPGSPAMGWTTQGMSRPDFSDDMDDYEAEGPLGAASSFQCSSRSSESFGSLAIDRNREFDVDEAITMQQEDSATAYSLNKPSRLNVHIGRGICVSDGAFKGCYIPGEIILASGAWQQIRNTMTPEPASALEMVQKPLMLRRRTSPKESSPPEVLRPSKTRQPQNKAPTPSKTNMKTLRTGPRSIGTKIDETAKPRSKPNECLSSLEKGFLADIDRRLHRLDYELSPGFRGPQGDGSDSKWWYEATPSTSSVAGRAWGAFSQGHSTKSRPLNPPFILRRSHTASDLVKVKYASANAASQLKRRASEQVLGPRREVFRAAQRPPNEPAEGAIDTAAWMLRRPPMMVLREDLAENTLLFTSGRGPARTLSAWQQRSELLNKPLQQALDGAAAVSKIPVKYLKRFGKLNGARNMVGCCKDEKFPARLEVLHDDASERRNHVVIGETSYVGGFEREGEKVKTPGNRTSKGGVVVAATMEGRTVGLDFSSAYRSPKRTMML